MQIEVNSERWLDLKDLRGEVWRVVEDTIENGTFLISNYGRLKRLPFYGGRYHFPEMIFKVHESRKNGYYKCRIGNKKYPVHRLVAMAFIPPKLWCKEVDHKNNNKKDNRARNLRWVTRKTNANNPVTRWDTAKKRGAIMFEERPELPRTQVNLNKYNPLICVSKNIFIAHPDRDSRLKDDANIISLSPLPEEGRVGEPFCGLLFPDM